MQVKADEVLKHLLKRLADLELEVAVLKAQLEESKPEPKEEF